MRYSFCKHIWAILPSVLSLYIFIVYRWCSISHFICYAYFTDFWIDIFFYVLFIFLHSLIFVSFQIMVILSFPPFSKDFFVCVVTSRKYNVWELSVLSKYFCISRIFVSLRVFLYISSFHSNKILCDFHGIHKLIIVCWPGIMKNRNVRFSFYIKNCCFYGNSSYHKNHTKNHISSS